MKKIAFVFVSIYFLFLGIAVAAELTDRDAKILKEAGIPLYSNAEFLNGGLGDEFMGARFACSASVKDVRDFYRKKFPTWALNSEYGSWILYDGKPSKSPAAYMGKKQISVTENKNLPAWFGVSKDKITELMIVVPPKK